MDGEALDLRPAHELVFHAEGKHAEAQRPRRLRDMLPHEDRSKNALIVSRLFSVGIRYSRILGSKPPSLVRGHVVHCTGRRPDFERIRVERTRDMT